MISSINIYRFSEKIVIFFPFVYYPSSDDWENIRKSLEDFNKSLDLDNDFIPSLLGKELSLSSNNGWKLFYKISIKRQKCIIFQDSNAKFSKPKLKM